MTIYIATDGEYSDYCIEAVFTDKNQAELFCATHGCYLEEYEADQAKIETNKKPKRIWCFISNFSKFWTNNVITFSDIEDFSHYEKNVSLDTSIDEETAKKIIYDKYAKWKAEQQNI